MREAFVGNNEVARFTSTLEDDQDVLVGVAKECLKETSVDGESLVRALEYLIWGNVGTSLLLQCDVVEDMPIVKRCVEVLIGPPSKRVYGYMYYGGVGVSVLPAYMYDMVQVLKKDVFYIGSMSDQEMLEKHGIEVIWYEGDDDTWER